MVKGPNINSVHVSTVCFFFVNIPLQELEQLYASNTIVDRQSNGNFFFNAMLTNFFYEDSQQKIANFVFPLLLYKNKEALTNPLMFHLLRFN